MTVLSTPARFDRTSALRFADWLAVGVAITLPWSTSAAGICLAAWLVVLLPALPAAAVKREVATAAGGLPVLLWCFAAIGMLWADVDWSVRFAGLGSFSRLLAIPLLLAQFRRSDRGDRVISGFLISTTIVLATSFALVLVQRKTGPDKLIGIPVHDDIFQNAEFLLCAFGLLGYAFDKVGKRLRPAAFGLFGLGAFFLANVSIVIFSRIVVVVTPVLVALLGWRVFHWRGILGAFFATIVIGTVAWFASANLRERFDESTLEIHEYLATNKANSIGSHTAFLKESVLIVAGASIIGHGTGSIKEQFRRITAGETGASAVATDNPHNQTFAVAIQLGLIGGLILWAMWIAHLLLFRGKSIAAWLGLLVVVENIVFSAVHSHLFDFANGGLYVFGVGVLGGMVLRERAAPAAKDATERT
jgi:O-antigen ligase